MVLFISVFKLKTEIELTNYLGYSKELEPNEKVFLVHYHHLSIHPSFMVFWWLFIQRIKSKKPEAVGFTRMH
jgi:hypothetical protein